MKRSMSTRRFETKRSISERRFGLALVGLIACLCRPSCEATSWQRSTSLPFISRPLSSSRYAGRIQPFGSSAYLSGAADRLRGGAVDVEEEDESSDDEEIIEAEISEIIEMEEEEEEEEEDSDTEEEYESAVEELIEADEISDSEDSFDEQLTLPSGLQMGSLFGVMLLSRKVDMFDKRVVRLGRFLFIAYLLLHQAFLVYVRITAKLNNDRTPVSITNPLSGIVNSQLGQKDGGAMMKDLASQFLSSKSTVLEYDLRQAKGMNSSLLFNMLFMWFLHFKMGQTQPLFAQTCTGTLNLIYHPLFQVYVMGRNLKRPFATKGLPGMPPERTNSVGAAEEDAVPAATEGDEDGSDETESDEDESDSDEEDSDDDEDE